MTDQKIIIQGFGNVGSQVARILSSEYQAKIIGVSTVEGAVLNEQGLNINELFKYQLSHGSLKGFPNSQWITNEELLSHPCDILIPAALAGSIDEKIAQVTSAKIVVEAANAPITTRADHILADRGIAIIPGILANPGGVIVSYFEWVQNLQQLYWTREEVIQKLEKILISAYRRTYLDAEQHKCTLREASMRLALKEVTKSIQLRGF